MKKMLLILFSILQIGTAFSQDSLLGVMPVKNGNGYYEKIVVIDSNSKADLYIKAKRWITNTYNSAEKVIDFDDKESGEIILKGIFTQKLTLAMQNFDSKVYHQISIRMKDNKVKITAEIYKISYYVPPSQYNSSTNVNLTINQFMELAYPNEKNKIKYLKKADLEMNLTIESLINALKESKAKDDF